MIRRNKAALWPLGLYALCVVGGGALVAPFLYAAGQALVHSDMLPALAPFGLPVYVRRAVLVLALCGFVPLLRYSGIDSLQDLGLRRGPEGLPGMHLLLRGLALGAGSVALAAGLLLLFARLHAQVPSAAVFARAAGLAAATAMAVSCLEELLFRGLLLGLLQRSLPARWALGWSSVIFAVLHFVAPVRHGPTGAADLPWYAGFAVLCDWHLDVRDWQVFTSLLTLLLVGFCLGLSRLRSRSLYFAIGLHGGWVFALRLVQQLTALTPSSAPFVAADMRGGLMPVLLAVGCTAVLLGARPDAPRRRG